MGKAKSTDADRQVILREQIICQLRTLSEPLTTAELIHELSVFRRIGAADLPPINETSVYAALEDLMLAGKVDEAPSGVWHYVRNPGVKEPRQKALFEQDRKMEATCKVKIVTCPDCGANLKNAPHKDYAVCTSCPSTKTYPRFTEPERTQAKCMSRPIAKRMDCHDTWWTITGQPGIWGARFTREYPGTIQARFQAAGGISKAWSIGYFGRLEKEEAELRTVLGMPAVEDQSETV